MKHREVAEAIESVAPLSLQEDWDNSGWQVGNPADQTTGVMVCVDVTPEILDEAAAKGCNLVVAHHPLLFRATRNLLGRNRPERVAAQAIRRGISIYSSHTALDCAPQGINQRDAEMLGLLDTEPLDPSNGLGRVGRLAQPLTPAQLIQRVKTTFGAPVVRCSRPRAEEMKIERVAVGGGACADMLPQAIAKGCQAMITSDAKLNFFLDHRDDILLIDSGHYETEQCSRQLLAQAIASALPCLPLHISQADTNPVLYR